MKKKNKDMEKSIIIQGRIKIILGTILILLCIVALSFKWLKEQEKEQERQNLIKSIQSHYHNFVEVEKTIDLYQYQNNEYQVVGKVYSGEILELEEMKIEKETDQYFKIKNTEYYIHYKNIKEGSKKEYDISYLEYIPFSTNVITKENAILYSEKEAYQFKNSLELKLYVKDENYYVEWNNRIFFIKQDSVLELKEVELENPVSTSIPVLDYSNVVKSSDYNFKEDLELLKEKNIITLDQYRLWLDSKVQLKENSILLISSEIPDQIRTTFQEYGYTLNLIPEDLKWNSSNKVSTPDNTKDSINSYSIKEDTTLEQYKKMLNGEEVVIVTYSHRDLSGNATSIPVLNYHFFYDSSLGESCNEHICEEVSTFREQLDYLKNNGYKTLTIEEFRAWLYGEIELPAKSVLITVDDGAMGTSFINGNKLIPILEEYDMHATLFLITAWWDLKNYQSPNLDVESHGYDIHFKGNCGSPRLQCLSHEELLYDLNRSIEILGTNTAFCYPFYSYNYTAIEAIKQAGFKMAFVGGNYNATRSQNKYLLPRYPIYKTTSLQQFINMVS